MASAASSSAATLTDAHAQEQLPEFVERAASLQQLAALCLYMKAQAMLSRTHLNLESAHIRMRPLAENTFRLQQEMATLPVGGDEWLSGLRMLRLVLAQQRQIQDELQQDADDAMHAAQNLLDAVHAVFALPKVERTTDLLPELVGIVGEFLSTATKAKEYVSIHALPRCRSHAQRQSKALPV
jgi:putative hemolysin